VEENRNTPSLQPQQGIAEDALDGRRERSTTTVDDERRLISYKVADCKVAQIKTLICQLISKVSSADDSTNRNDSFCPVLWQVCSLNNTPCSRVVLVYVSTIQLPFPGEESRAGGQFSVSGAEAFLPHHVNEGPSELASHLECIEEAPPGGAIPGGLQAELGLQLSGQHGGARALHVAVQQSALRSMRLTLRFEGGPQAAAPAQPLPLQLPHEADQHGARGREQQLLLGRQLRGGARVETGRVWDAHLQQPAKKREAKSARKATGMDQRHYFLRCPSGPVALELSSAHDLNVVSTL
jgi:hypothetical protein